MALKFSNPSPNPSRSYDRRRGVIASARDGFRRIRRAGGLHVSVPTATFAVPECETNPGGTPCPTLTLAALSVGFH